MSATDLETLAELIAAQGRDELLRRVREAYALALDTHSDLIAFDGGRVEAMVQRSAAEADGLQWRRALAEVAAGELGIELGDALTHPAVVRAHQIVGAQTYESALSNLALPAPELAPEPRVAPVAVARVVEVEPEVEVASQPEVEPQPDVEPEVASQPEPEVEPASDGTLGQRADEFAEEFMAGVEADQDVDDDLTFEHDVIEPGQEQDATAEFGATHLGGVASLPASEEVDLRLSEAGLDLLGSDGTIVGRLGWEDITALEVTVPHGRRRRRGAPRLVVHTAGGSARFEVPELSGEELQSRVEPLMSRYGH